MLKTEEKERRKERRDKEGVCMKTMARGRDVEVGEGREKEEKKKGGMRRRYT